MCWFAHRGRHVAGQIASPLDLWISGKWFSDVGDIQLPEPRVENYDFDEEVWDDARIDKVMINVA